MRLLTITAAVGITVSTVAYAVTTGPAPSGDPKTVAARELKEAEHPCPKVTSAVRRPDGSIKALCSNSEDYLIATVNGQTIALRCSAARKMGVKGC